MPASTSRTPSRTFSGVSRLMRPSSSSSPQSPQVEPGGRCFHRFVTLSSPSGRRALRDRRRPRCLYRPVGLHFWAQGSAARVAVFRSIRGLASRRRKVTTMTEKELVVSADGHILEPTDLFAPACPSTCGTGGSGRTTSRSSRSSRAGPGSSGGCTRPGSRAGRSPATARPAGGCPRATPR